MSVQGVKRTSSRKAVKKSGAQVSAVEADVQTSVTFSPAKKSIHPLSIEQRAYEIYVKRVSSGIPGDDVSDWLKAESELRAEEE